MESKGLKRNSSPNRTDNRSWRDFVPQHETIGAVLMKRKCSPNRIRTDVPRFSDGALFSSFLGRTFKPNPTIFFSRHFKHLIINHSIIFHAIFTIVQSKAYLAKIRGKSSLLNVNTKEYEYQYKNPRGRPSKLDARQVSEFKRHLKRLKTKPSCEKISKYIKKKYGISITRQGICALLKRKSVK